MSHYAMVVIVDAPDVDTAYDTVTDQLCPEASEHLAEFVSEPWPVQPSLAPGWSTTHAIDQRE